MSAESRNTSVGPSESSERSDLDYKPGKAIRGDEGLKTKFFIYGPILMKIGMQVYYSYTITNLQTDFKYLAQKKRYGLMKNFNYAISYGGLWKVIIKKVNFLKRGVLPKGSLHRLKLRESLYNYSIDQKKIIKVEKRQNCLQQLSGILRN